MLVFDRAHVVLPIDPDASPLARSCCTAAVIAAFYELFEHVWESAIPVHRRQTPTP